MKEKSKLNVRDAAALYDDIVKMNLRISEHSPRLAYIMSMLNSRPAEDDAKRTISERERSARIAPAAFKKLLLPLKSYERAVLAVMNAADIREAARKAVADKTITKSFFASKAGVSWPTFLKWIGQNGCSAKTETSIFAGIKSGLAEELTKITLVTSRIKNL